jgi:hypothetical protein
VTGLCEHGKEPPSYMKGEELARWASIGFTELCFLELFNYEMVLYGL